MTNSLENVLALAEQFEKAAQKLPETSPSAHTEKELSNREVREKIREIKSLAEMVEKKYLGLKYAGFMTKFSMFRDLNKAKSYLEEAIRLIERA